MFWQGRIVLSGKVKLKVKTNRKNSRMAVWLAASVVLLTCSIVEAQQPKKLPRIGFFIDGFPPPQSATPPLDTEAFYKGLLEQGFTVGKDVIIDHRYSNGESSDSFPRHAAELVTSKVDLIFATSSPFIKAAARATTKVPIVALSVTL
jgi:ABC-type uncharacterized transport system substrate-binding protein